MIKISKHCVQNFFIFAKILKWAIKHYEIRKLFFINCTKKRCSQLKPQLKVEIEDGREPSTLHNKTRHS